MMKVFITGVLDHRCNPDAGYALAKLQSNMGFSAWEWKRRFCRLDDKGLSYWAPDRLPRKDDQNFEKQFTWGRILEVKATGDREKDSRFQFKIVISDGDRIVLAAESEEDMGRWVQIIRETKERSWTHEAEKGPGGKMLVTEEAFKSQNTTSVSSIDPKHTAKETAKSVKGLVYSTASLFTGTVQSTVSAMQSKLEGAMASVQDQMEILAGRDDSSSSDHGSFDSVPEEKEEDVSSWRLSEHEKLHRDKYLEGDKELLEGLWSGKDASIALQESERNQRGNIGMVQRTQSIWRTYSNSSLGPTGAASNLNQWIAALEDDDDDLEPSGEGESPPRTIELHSVGGSSSGGRDSPSIGPLSRKGSDMDPRTRDLKKQRKEVLERTKKRLNLVSSALESLEERVVFANKLTQDLDVMEDSISNSLRELDSLLIENLESAASAVDNNNDKKHKTVYNIRHISQDLVLEVSGVVNQLHSDIDEVEGELEKSQQSVEAARKTRLSCEDSVVDRTPPRSYTAQLKEFLYHSSLFLLRLLLWVGVSLFIVCRHVWSSVARFIPSSVRSSVKEALFKKKKAAISKWSTSPALESPGPSPQTKPNFPRREASVRRLESLASQGGGTESGLGESSIRNKMKVIKSERENRKNLKLRRKLGEQLGALSDTESMTQESPIPVSPEGWKGLRG